MTSEQTPPTKPLHQTSLVKAKNMSLAATLVLIIVVGVVNTLLPQFVDIFDGMGAELPAISLLVISSFNFWWVIPGITLVFFIAMQTPQLSQNEQVVSLTNKVAIGGFVMAVLILVLSFVAIYSPAYPAG